MKLTIRKLLPTSLLLLTAAVGAQAGSSGVIHFTGTIVEPGCEFNQAGNNVATRCWQDGQYHTTTWSPSRGDRTFANNRASSSVKWLDEQKKMGIVTVSYN